MWVFYFIINTVSKEKPFVNIQPKAHELKAGGAQDPMPQEANWGLIKPELYAITAVLIDRVMDRTFQTMPEFNAYGRIPESFYDERGAIGALRGNDDLADHMYRDKYDSLDFAFSFVLRDAWKKEEEFLTSESTDPKLKSLHDRYAHLLSAAQDSGFRDPDVKPSAFLSNGIRTACETFTNFLRLTEWMYENQYKATGIIPTAEEMSQTVKNSYHLIAYLAGRDSLSFTQSTRNFVYDHDKLLAPFKSNWKPSYFVLEKTASGRSLALTEEGKKTVERDENQRFTNEKYFELDQNRTGCPALVDFGKGSGIRRLFDKVVEISGPMYERARKLW